jgi:hypothetical protein
MAASLSTFAESVKSDSTNAASDTLQVLKRLDLVKITYHDSSEVIYLPKAVYDRIFSDNLIPCEPLTEEELIKFDFSKIDTAYLSQSSLETLLSDSAAIDTIKQAPSLLLSLSEFSKPASGFVIYLSKSMLEGIKRGVLETADSTATDSTTFQPLVGVTTTATVAALYLPKRLYEGLLFAYAASSQALEPERIGQVKEYFDPKGNPWGWYPIFIGASDWRLRAGAKVFYKRKVFRSSYRLTATGYNKWEQRISVTLRDRKKEHVGQINFSLNHYKDDDMHFYGIGSYPESDERSFYLPNNIDDFTRFSQEVLRLQTIFAIRTSRLFQARYTYYYQQRTIDANGKGLSRIFDIDQLPGGLGTGFSIYQEIATRVETSERNRTGLDVEGYIGVNLENSGNKGKILRYGVDARLNLVLNTKFILKPRVVLNLIKNITEDEPVSFTNYPRHPSFRGTSSRILLMSDNVVSVPSLALQYKVNRRYSARLFCDYLLVGRELTTLIPSEGTWATGLLLVYHNSYTDLAGVVFAVSPHSFRLTAFVGTEPNRNERSRWR